MIEGFALSKSCKFDEDTIFSGKPDYRRTARPLLDRDIRFLSSHTDFGFELSSPELSVVQSCVSLEKGLTSEHESVSA